MSNSSLTNLFEELCEPHAYIPRRASEEVLKCLSMLIRDGEPAVVLHGPAGIGKSMVLRVLSERFKGERRVVYTSLADLSEPPDLCHRILDELSEPVAGDPVDALIRAATTAQPKLLLLVDHPNLAPVSSSLQLASVAKAAAPHLTVVFAIDDDMGAQQFARALSVEASVTTLGFNQRMDTKEASAYVRLRLARTSLPAALRSQLDERVMQWLTEGAQAGIPREINRRASELLRSFEAGGAAAMKIPIQASNSIASETIERPPAAPRAVDPSSHSAGSLVDPRPPSFPMLPGDGLASAASGPIGGGSLGGMLLRSQSGVKPNFDMNLELGRSLSSGLLDGASTRPSTKDGQPVAKEEVDAAAATAAAGARSGEEGPRGRRVAWIVASLAAFAVGSAFVATRNSSEADRAAPIEALSRNDRFETESLPASRVEVPWPSSTTGVTSSLASDSLPDDVLASLDLRPTLVDGPMGDAASQAIEISTKRKSEIAETDEVPTTVQPKVNVAIAPARVRAPKPAKSPIVLPSRSTTGSATHPNSFVRISIEIEPGSEISVDGESIGVAPFSEIFVEMGPHTFIATMPDGVRVQQLVDVQEGTDIVEF